MFRFSLKKILLLLGLVAIIVAGRLYLEVYKFSANKQESIQFEILKDESLFVLSERLHTEQVIRSPWLFRKFLQVKGVDKSIHAGMFTVTEPITLARVVESLSRPSVEERTITILPGWGLHEVAEYFAKEGIATPTSFYNLVGEPITLYSGKGVRIEAVQDLRLLLDKPTMVGFEGYLRPDTYRIYADASLEEIVVKLITARAEQFTEQMYSDIAKSGRTVHEVMTMAGLVEREVRHQEDMAKVADIFWRRHDANWGMQADSTIHYITGKSGSVFTTAADRQSESAWNTYRYRGLPPGPISNPSIGAIMAAIYPEKNDAWYFLTDFEGVARYGRTLDEHNANVNQYLR